MKKNNKGFTLIELLVVIAIIGLLSTLAVVSLNNARAKARDARRVSDVKQISTLIEMETANTETGSYLTVLTGAGCAADNTILSTCTINGQSLAQFSDPQAAAATACTAAGIVCNYTLAAVPTDTNYEIAFYLEDGAGGLNQGNGCVQAGGAITSGACTGL